MTRVKDLVVLAADKSIEAAITGLLSRPDRLGARALTWDSITHPHRDPGCRAHRGDLLRAQHRRYDHALVIFDREGCGRDAWPVSRLEETVEEELAGTGWGDRARVVVLDPELEAWVWSDDPEVPVALGWVEKSPNLRQWLAREGLLSAGEWKPRRPRVALERCLRKTKKPRSSAIFGQLAAKVDTSKCTDRSFDRFRMLISMWFPA